MGIQSKMHSEPLKIMKSKSSVLFNTKIKKSNNLLLQREIPHGIYVRTDEDKKKSRR